MSATPHLAAEAAASQGQLGAATIGAYLDAVRPRAVASRRARTSRVSRVASDRIPILMVDLRREPKQAFVVPQGELDLSSVTTVRTEIDWLRDVGFGSMVLDLRELTFIDSSGLHLAADQVAKGDVTVYAGSGQVQRAFVLAGLVDVLTTPQVVASE